MADLGANAFPDPEELSAAISDTEIEVNLTVADAAVALKAESVRFHAYDDVEDLAIKALEREDAAELADAMLPIRNAIANELRARDLFVGIEIIDHLLFTALRGGEEASPVRSVLDALHAARIGDPGLLVFAVHSLGLTADDLDAVLSQSAVELIDADWGIAITPQTKTLDATIGFLERTANAFGVQGSLNRDLMMHWRRSRPTRWLEQNPLLAVRVSEASGTYFGNERMLLTRLQAVTVLISMLSALQPVGDGERSTLSTYVLNNQQTLDIQHYLVLSPGRAAGDQLGGDCVPISRGRPDLVAMSELRLDLNPRYWEEHKVEADRVARAVTTVYRAYMRDGYDPSDTSDASRRNRRWFEALIYFQRSFSGQTWRDTITLATAFELLLHDPSKSDTSRRIRNAITRLFGGSSEGKTYAEAFKQIFQARNQIVHGGVLNARYDIDLPRRAFVSAFLEHVEDESLP